MAEYIIKEKVSNIDFFKVGHLYKYHREHEILMYIDEDKMLNLNTGATQLTVPEPHEVEYLGELTKIETSFLN